MNKQGSLGQYRKTNIHVDDFSGNSCCPKIIASLALTVTLATISPERSFHKLPVNQTAIA